MNARARLAVSLLLSLFLAGCLEGTGLDMKAFQVHPKPAAPAPAAAPMSADQSVGATIVPGISQPAGAVGGPPVTRLRSGDVNLNFPGADVQVVAKAVLGDLLGQQFTVPPELHTPVTVVTQHPIARADVFRLFEASLANAGLAVTQRDGVFAILPLEQARGAAPVVNGDTAGFATEVIPLKFVSAEELRRLIDPILPNVITQVDTAQNTIAVSGTSGQRASIRDLVRQFDVDWLRNTSFALFTPQRTDARLIVPELDKLINANGAPTKGLVRLIAMDRLNGILAVSTQPQYLNDVRRWIEVLDRQGESSERRVFVYRVQNGRSDDLARVLAGAFGGGKGGSSSASGRGRQQPALGGGGQDDLGQPQSQGATNGQQTNNGSQQGGTANGPASASATPVDAGPVNVDISTDDLHAKVSSDETNNAIVVYATPRDYGVIEEALRKLDVPPTQVMIEAAIVEVTLNDQLQYGVQWSFANRTSSGALSQGTTSAPLSLFPGFTYAYTHGSIAASLSALEAITKINVVSAPKLMVLNNQTAALQVGDQVPTLSETSTSTIGTNAPVVNSIEYKDIGIILKITPRVNSGGVVLLDMSQEVSAVAPTTTGSAVINSPTFSTRKIATEVAVQDGEVIALGGLISASVNDVQTGIPFLSRIKILNTLFGNTNNNTGKTELIVLLRPVVVRSVDDGRAMTDELRDKLQSLRPLLPTPNTMP
jgi:general secretion pathway protein D